MLEFHNDITRCLANASSTHNPLLQQLSSCQDTLVACILILVGWDIKSDTNQLILVGFDSIAFRELQLNFVTIVSRQDTLRDLCKIQGHQFVARTNFEFLQGKRVMR